MGKVTGKVDSTVRQKMYTDGGPHPFRQTQRSALAPRGQYGPALAVASWASPDPGARVLADGRTARHSPRLAAAFSRNSDPSRM